MVSTAPVLVAAVGMTLVILCRQIDISIGSIFSICGVVGGLLAEAGMPTAFVGLGTLVAGSGLGAINGALVAGLGLPSIVVTLATSGHRPRVARATCVKGNSFAIYLRDFSGLEPDKRQANGWSSRSRSWFSPRSPGVCITLQWAERCTQRAQTRRPPGWRESGLVAWFSESLSSWEALAGLAALLSAVRFADVDPNSQAEVLSSR